MKRLVGCLSMLVIGCYTSNIDINDEGKVAAPQVEVVGKSITLGMERTSRAHTLLTGMLEAAPYTDRAKPMLITFTATNTQSEPVNIRFNSSMTAELLLIDKEGENLWSSSQDMMYAQALRDVTLEPGEAIVTNFSVPATTMNAVNAAGYRFGVKFAGQAVNGNDTMLINTSSTPLIVK